jgi:hypothetical protein
MNACLADAGADAILVGEALMRQPSPGVALAALLEGVALDEPLEGAALTAPLEDP